MPKHYGDFAPLEHLPAHILNALQEFLSGLGSFHLRIKPGAPTILQIPAGAGDDQVAIPIDGRWRYITSSIERVSPGGAARSLDVHVTASNNSYSSGTVTVGPDTFPVENDATSYAFALAITETGGTPPSVDLSRKIATAQWDGTAFTSLDPFVGGAAAPDVADGYVTAAKVAPSLKPSGGAAAGTEALRALGTTASTAAAGNDSRLSDSRAPTGAAGGDLSGTYPSPQIAAGVIVNADVNAAAAIAESKLALASDAAAGTASRRTLGTGATQAAAGNDPRLSDQRTPLDGSVTLVKLAAVIQQALFTPGDLKTTAIAVTAGSEPAGWLLCDGRAVSRATYAALFAALGNGTIHGAGDGSTTFNLPDFRGRVPIGAGTAAGDPTATAKALGSRGGAAKITLSAAEIPGHTHPDNIAYAGAGSHGHILNVDSAAVVAAGNNLAVLLGGSVATNQISMAATAVTAPLATSGTWSGAVGGHAHTGDTNVVANHTHAKSGGVLANTGGDGSHANEQPYQTINWLIKT